MLLYGLHVSCIPVRAQKVFTAHNSRFQCLSPEPHLTRTKPAPKPAGPVPQPPGSTYNGPPDRPDRLHSHSQANHHTHTLSPLVSLASPPGFFSSSSASPPAPSPVPSDLVAAASPSRKKSRVSLASPQSHSLSPSYLVRPGLLGFGRFIFCDGVVG